MKLNSWINSISYLDNIRLNIILYYPELLDTSLHINKSNKIIELRMDVLTVSYLTSMISSNLLYYLSYYLPYNRFILSPKLILDKNVYILAQELMLPICFNTDT